MEKVMRFEVKWFPRSRTAIQALQMAHVQRGTLIEDD